MLNERGSLIFESASDVIYQTGNLNVRVVVLPNRKNQSTGGIIPGIRVNHYNSAKYSDTNQLGNLNINVNKYIEFEYNEFNSSNRINKRFMFSYPSFDIVRSFFTEVYQYLVTSQETLYVNNGNSLNINQSISRTISSEAISKNGDILAAQPAVINTMSNNVVVPTPGVALMIGEQQYVQTLTLLSFQGLYETIMEYTDIREFNHKADFLVSTTVMATLAELLSGGVSHQPTMNTSNIGGSSFGGGFQNANSNNKSGGGFQRGNLRRQNTQNNNFQQKQSQPNSFQQPNQNTQTSFGNAPHPAEENYGVFSAGSNSNSIQPNIDQNVKVESSSFEGINDLMNNSSELEKPMPDFSPSQQNIQSSSIEDSIGSTGGLADSILKSAAQMSTDEITNELSDDELDIK